MSAGARTGSSHDVVITSILPGNTTNDTINMGRLLWVQSDVRGVFVRVR